MFFAQSIEIDVIYYNQVDYDTQKQNYEVDDDILDGTRGDIIEL